MVFDKVAVIRQIDFALKEWGDLRARSKYTDLSDLEYNIIVGLVTLLSDTIRRFAPGGSTYGELATKTLSHYRPTQYAAATPELVGILQSLRTAYENNYLQSVEELVHADVFTDFLEMAEYLLRENYKDPAAVLIGGVLEEHLRKLCMKYGMPVSMPDGGPRKAAAMNDDLAKVAYDKLTQKGVTFWLDLRNKAAHGHYGEYDAAQVRLMLMGVQDFLTRYRA